MSDEVKADPFVEQGYCVFQISDYEWFAAASEAEAVACACKEWGYGGDNAETRAEADGCFERADVDICNLDSNVVQTTEPGEKPVEKVTYRELLREMIELKHPLPAFFCGTEY